MFMIDFCVHSPFMLLFLYNVDYIDDEQGMVKTLLIRFFEENNNLMQFNNQLHYKIIQNFITLKYK